VSGKYTPRTHQDDVGVVLELAGVSYRDAPLARIQAHPATPLEWLQLAEACLDQAGTFGGILGASTHTDVISAIVTLEAQELAAQLVAQSVASGYTVTSEGSCALSDALSVLCSGCPDEVPGDPDANGQPTVVQIFYGRSEGILWTVRLTPERGPK
jgi:hypothetical protein